MSKFMQINELQIRDQDLLIETLNHEMNFRGKKLNSITFGVESYDSPKNLFGYRGDVRPEAAEVIIRRQNVGSMSNDIGFRRQESGNFQPLISEYDRSSGYGDVWLDQLSQRYAEKKYVQEMSFGGFSLSNKEVLADGSTAMTFAKNGVI